LEIAYILQIARCLAYDAARYYSNRLDSLKMTSVLVTLKFHRDVVISFRIFIQSSRTFPRKSEICTS